MGRQVKRHPRIGDQPTTAQFSDFSKKVYCEITTSSRVYFVWMVISFHQSIRWLLDISRFGRFWTTRKRQSEYYNSNYRNLLFMVGDTGFEPVTSCLWVRSRLVLCLFAQICASWIWLCYAYNIRCFGILHRTAKGDRESKMHTLNVNLNDWAKSLSLLSKK